MTLLVFGFSYVVVAAIYTLVNVLAVGERARSFKAVSPGLLSPLGIIFALFVAFTASQVPRQIGSRRASIPSPAITSSPQPEPDAVDPKVVNYP